METVMTIRVITTKMEVSIFFQNKLIQIDVKLNCSVLKKK